MLNDTYAKFYNPSSEYLAVDIVTVLFKGRVTAKQYIPKKYKRFGTKIYKFRDVSGYIYDTNIYLEKQVELNTDDNGTGKSGKVSVR
jgi:hypothetical protein